MKKTTLITTIAALSVIAITALSTYYFTGNKEKAPNTPEIKKEILVGIENGYYPYEFYNDKGEFIGLDVDLINYACNQLELNCKLVKGSFDALIPNLLYKKTDLVISALSVTEERKKQVAFSTPYIPASPAVFIVNNKDQATSAEIKTVGVQEGTTLFTYLNSLNKYKVITYPSFDTVMLDLKAQRIDAVFESFDVARKYLENPQEEVKVLGDKIINPIISQGTAIAFRKDDIKLREAFSAVIEEAKANGTLDTLRAKYGLINK